MSSLLDPLHPTTLFLQLKFGQYLKLSGVITLPPNSTITYNLSPPSGFVWITLMRTAGTPRDVATGNPVISPLIRGIIRHSSFSPRSSPTMAVESEFNFPWAQLTDQRVNDFSTTTVANASGLTVVTDFTAHIMEITDDKYPLYQRLWNGLFNFEILLGSLNATDIANLINILKSMWPQIPIPALPIPREVTASPTLAESRDGITRIEIP